MPRPGPAQAAIVAGHDRGAVVSDRFIEAAEVIAEYHPPLHSIKQRCRIATLAATVL